ncbi:uncharacterized protein LOC128230148 [Mya arenaria]|uniref:uncharacterized protein LOC128230148 n=1 Tax=Mya arenaria TaxID=6604 RepID=UPI0022E37961|nr:uncharacterized protein LOC128230148 [Mya arenaria]
MASFKQIIQKSLTAKRYSAIGMEGKENHGYAGTPGPKQNNRVQNDQPRQERFLRRNTSVTQSVRDVVGTFRQKIRKSTRQRKRLQHSLSSPCTPVNGKSKTSKKTPTRRGGYREVKMYSPFSFETPESSPLGFREARRAKWVDVETPTRLRKEVEDLTANMQALVSLTPNTLKSRASRRSLHQKNSPQTISSKPETSSSRKVRVTAVRRNIETDV